MLLTMLSSTDPRSSFKANQIEFSCSNFIRLILFTKTLNNEASLKAVKSRGGVGWLKALPLHIAVPDDKVGEDQQKRLYQGARSPLGVARLQPQIM